VRLAAGGDGWAANPTLYARVPFGMLTTLGGRRVKAGGRGNLLAASGALADRDACWRAAYC